jgi:hypothetical protein
MALPAGTTWEVRPSVGADTSGGGFVAGASGTDFSQQDAAQYNATDLAVDATTNTKVTSASHNFVAADVGNLINVSAGTGWTVGFYQIVSVAANAATLDRSPAATSTTGGTYAVGGALATVSKALANATASNQLWLKATADYSVTAVQKFNFVNNAGPMKLEGYTTTRGDNGKFTWKTATNSINLIESDTGTPGNYVFKNIIFKSTAGTPGDGFHAKGSTWNDVAIKNCVLQGFQHGVNGNFSVDWNIINLLIESSEIKSCTGDGIRNSSNTRIIASFLHDNGGYGAQIISNQPPCTLVAIRSVFKSNTLSGLGMLANTTGVQSCDVFLDACAFIGNTVDGLHVLNNFAANQGPILVWNSVFESNGGWGINLTGGGLSWSWDSFRNNAFRSNTSGDMTGGPVRDAADVTLTAEPFTSISTGDFTLNATAGGGAACKAAGYPSAIPGG